MSASTNEKGLRLNCTEGRFAAVVVLWPALFHVFYLEIMWIFICTIVLVIQVQFSLYCKNGPA